MSRAAEDIGQIPQRRFTVEEYHRMAETGIVQPDERVELIRGVVQPMSAKNRAHVVATTRLHQRLVKYWAVNLVDQELVVFSSAFEGAYRHRATYRTGDRIAPRAWSDVVMDVSELFLTE